MTEMLINGAYTQVRTCARWSVQITIPYDRESNKSRLVFSSTLTHPDTHSVCYNTSSPHTPGWCDEAQTKHVQETCLQCLGRREDRKCAERWESSRKAPEINGNAAK